MKTHGALAIMTKAPRAGQVKTRLVPPLNSMEAAELHKCFLRDTATAIATAAETVGARGVVVYTPADAEQEVAEFVRSDFALLPQRGETLSERLVNAAQDIFNAGFSTICFINSDSPTLPAEIYASGVQALTRSGDRVVLGPAEDGGYYLIGIQKLQTRLFEEIEWSTERVLEQTIARAREIPLAVELLPPWYDVDDVKSLRRLYEDLFGGPEKSYDARETRRFLETLDRTRLFG